MYSQKIIILQVLLFYEPILYLIFAGYASGFNGYIPSNRIGAGLSSFFSDSVTLTTALSGDAEITYALSISEFLFTDSCSFFAA